MLIYVGADHRGFELKESLKSFLQGRGYVEVVDFGNTKKDTDDDYPDFAAAVAEKVRRDPEGARGILICGSGAGVDIVANKFPGVRSVLAISPDQVFDARRDDDVNVLSIAADGVELKEAEEMVQIFLSTPFGREERLQRRLEKIAKIERELYKEGL